MRPPRSNNRRETGEEMPGGNKNISPKDGVATQFQKGQSGNPKGRPVKIFSQIAREYKERGIEKATDAVVKEAFEFLLALPVSEILEMAGNPKIENNMPSLLRLMAKDMMGKNGLAAIKEMLDRAHGKALQKQALDHTTNGKDVNPLLLLSVEDQERIQLAITRHGETKDE